MTLIRCLFLLFVTVVGAGCASKGYPPGVLPGISAGDEVRTKWVTRIELATTTDAALIAVAGLPGSYSDIHAAAELGDSMAMAIVAVANYHWAFHLRTPSAPQYRTAAFHWATRAADAWEPRGMLVLAQIFENGVGVNSDRARALSLYQTAATHGSPIARYKLFEMYRDGAGAPRDERLAHHWMQAGFEDYKRSYKLLHAATKNGDSLANAELARRYIFGIYGPGTSANRQLAITYGERAAKHGHAVGFYYAGYANMLFLHNKEIGRSQLREAERLGDPRAQAAIAHLDQQLQEEAQARAARAGEGGGAAGFMRHALNVIHAVAEPPEQPSSLTIIPGSSAATAAIGLPANTSGTPSASAPALAPPVSGSQETMTTEQRGQGVSSTTSQSAPGLNQGEQYNPAAPRSPSGCSMQKSSGTLSTGDSSTREDAMQSLTRQIAGCPTGLENLSTPECHAVPRSRWELIDNKPARVVLPDAWRCSATYTCNASLVCPAGAARGSRQ